MLKGSNNRERLGSGKVPDVWEMIGKAVQALLAECFHHGAIVGRDSLL